MERQCQTSRSNLLRQTSQKSGRRGRSRLSPCAGSWHSCSFKPWSFRRPWLSSLHVHEYKGHDHPDHHHGPAAHDHDHPATADQDHHSLAGEDAPAWHADPCEPGRHAVGVSMTCACIPQAHVDLAELPGPTIAFPSAPVRSTVPFTDVRVHGPPFDARTPSRAPPLNPHA